MRRALDEPTADGGAVMLGIASGRWAARSPKMLDRAAFMRTIEPMIDLIATASRSERVDLFHRFAVMRHWHETAGIPFATFLSADQLHMNDWSYGCLANLLAKSIGEATSLASVSETR